MTEPTRWDIDLNRADGTAQRNAAGDMVAMLQAWNVLVPVEPDYEADKVTDDE